MSDDIPSGAPAPQPPQYPGASTPLPPTEPVPVVDPTLQLPVAPLQPLTAPHPPFAPPMAPPSYSAPVYAPPTAPPMSAPPYGTPAAAPEFTVPTARGGNRGRFIVLGVLLASVVGLAVVAALLAGRNDDDVATKPPTPTSAVQPPRFDSTDSTEADTPAGDELPRSVADLARSTVMILLVDGSGQPLCSGSGAIVETDGTILTNAHVLAKDEFCPYEAVQIAVTEDAGTPPEPLYEADVLAVDDGLDLAVLRVARHLDGSASTAQFTPTVIGDSDTIELGDSIRILGYPDIGGETITFTVGTVSGFTS
ncbi:MAG: serine protease [Actinomycetota bacterium]|nr:serine protease [Actinomycetota bacterium]